MTLAHFPIPSPPPPIIISAYVGTFIYLDVETCYLDVEILTLMSRCVGGLFIVKRVMHSG